MSSNQSRHIGKAKLAVAMASGLVLAGCFGPDYPTEGRLNTQEVTDRAKVVDVRGHVYGVKEGTVDLLNVFETDRKALYQYQYDVWNAVIAGEEVPNVSVGYPHNSEFDIDQYMALNLEGAKKLKADVTAAVEEEREAAKTLLIEKKEELGEVEQSREAYSAAIEDEQSKYQAVKTQLDGAINAYQSEIASMKTEFSQLLTDFEGYSGTYQRNPLGSYQVMTFKGQPPATCPDKRFHLEIDVLDEREECVLIRLGNDLYPIQDKISDLLSPYYVKMKNLEEKLGDKGGWGSDSSGLYAALENAEDALKQAAGKAAEEHGTERELNYKERRAKAAVEIAEQKVTEVSQDAYLQGRLEQNDDAFEGVNELVDVFIESAESDLLSRIVQDVPVAFFEEGETGTFEGLSGGYEAVIYMGVIVAEKNGSRDGQELVIKSDLTDKAVLEADELVLDVDKRAVLDARYLDLDDQEEVNEKLLEIVGDIHEAREDSKG